MIGYGTEFDLGRNWSAKAEYDYIDFGSRTALGTDGLTVVRTVAQSARSRLA
jgi:opacity protein-like surface antigen